MDFSSGWTSDQDPPSDDIPFCSFSSGFLSFLKSRSEAQAAKLVISDYKHNTTGRPFSIIIHRDLTVQFCPVEFLLRWCRVRGCNSGPLFSLADGSAVKTEVFTRQLKGALAFCDLDRSSYKSDTRRFGLLVVGNPMHLSYTYDCPLLGQIRVRLLQSCW